MKQLWEKRSKVYQEDKLDKLRDYDDSHREMVLYQEQEH